MLDIEQLLVPISELQPCGENIAFSSEVDAVARARRADDPSLEQGAWVTALKEADWKFVAERCAQLLATRSKDLQLAVWLAEASAKTVGLRGLGDSLVLIAALCERYWDQLYPLPDEDGFEQRTGNLSWLTARIPTLVQALPVTEGVGSAYSLNDFKVARLHAAEEGATLEQLESARQRSSRAFYQALLQDAGRCEAALSVLKRVVDERLGASGPGFTAAESAVQGLIDFIAPLAREPGAVEEAPGPGAEPADDPAGPTPALSSGPIRSRAQALVQLRRVAEFFRRTEPHSPVAYLADKAANWGEQPLHVWLRSVVKDDSSFAHIEELLGINDQSR